MCILQNKKLSANILAHRNFQKNISLFSRLQFTPKEGSHLVLEKKKKSREEEPSALLGTTLEHLVTTFAMVKDWE